MNGREAQSLIPPYGPRSILPSLSGTAAQAAQLATDKIRKPYVRKPYVRGIRHARSPRQRDTEIKRDTGRLDFRNGGIYQDDGGSPCHGAPCDLLRFLTCVRPQFSLLDVLCCLAAILLTAYKRQAFRWTHRVNLA